MSTLPPLVALALYGYSSGAWGVAAALALGIALSLTTRWRADLSTGTRRTVLIIASGAGVALGFARTPELGYGAGTLPGLAAAFALAALIPAGARAWMRLPGRAYGVTFALAIVGVGACGAARLDAPYAVGTIAFFAASLAALRAVDPARARVSELTTRDKLVGAGVAVVTLAIAAGIAHTLPILYDWTQARFDASYEFIGFKAELHLEGLDDLKRSDEIVLRVSGERTDYLRGAVYDRFDAHSSSWGLGYSGTRPLKFANARSANARGVDVRRVGGWGERYFLPMHVGAIGSSAGEAIVDVMGVMHPFASKRYDHYWFDPAAPDELDVHAPTLDDVLLPDRLRAPLEKLLAEWTLPADAPDAILVKIAHHFDEEYTYSLSFTRPAKDPILDFLFTNKQGHCEYFASAMVLLARAAKIPARVVAGYRVAERNPLTGEYIVRQNNAHAWVEAWLPGRGWTTVDPTPASKVEENLARNTSMARALADVVSSWWTVVVDKWDHLAPLDLAMAAGGLGALYVLVRLFRWQRSGRGGSATDDSADDRPLPCLDRLIEALAAKGVAHPASEPLERLAARLAEAELREPAELVERYAAFRYGGVGDAASIAREMDRCAAELKI